MSEPVIELQDLPNGVVQIRMQDRVNKNTFTDELICGLSGTFAQISRSSQCKVVVLTGYDSYFSSGSTPEGLRDLYSGKCKFADKDLYSLALDCPVPVIAAMQGHGIGGGFVLGMFADFPILARESTYTANFMKYGLTPGMGATYILPQKLGISLAQEMMLAAGTYRGEELQKRGVPFPVLPRESVLTHALELAATLAEKPRIALVTLKDHLVASLREQLPRFVERELAMHEITFHHPDVKDRIQAAFGKQEQFT